MNQQQKAIAEIIKKKSVGNDLPDTALEIAEDLADLFEKEDKSCCICRNCGKNISYSHDEPDYEYEDKEIIYYPFYVHSDTGEHLCEGNGCGASPKPHFNRQEFLKACGVGK